MRLVKIIKTSDVGPVEDHKYQYELILPDALASWDVYDYWEKERLLHMQSKIKKGDVVFEVGAENGWLSALISKYMSGNMVLIEPEISNWSKIKKIWELNNLQEPLFNYCGFADSLNTDKDFRGIEWRGIESKFSDNIMKYRHVFDSKDIPSVTLDFISQQSKLIPDVLNIDTEGSEFEVLFGAKDILKKYKPKVYLSIHEDLLVKHYKTSTRQIINYMSELSYYATLLGTDHEEHWYFE